MEELKVTPFEVFFSQVEAYRDAVMREGHAISERIALAHERKRKIFCADRWYDPQTQEIWYPIKHPTTNSPKGHLLLTKRYRRHPDGMLMSHPPPNALLSDEHPTEWWAWGDALDNQEDSYTAWTKTQEVFKKSAEFVVYLLEHQSEVRQWVLETERRGIDSYHHAWEAFIREFSKRAGVTSDLFDPQTLQSGFRKLFLSRN